MNKKAVNLLENWCVAHQRTTLKSANAHFAGERSKNLEKS
jgi:hypothetical protein